MDLSDASVFSSVGCSTFVRDRTFIFFQEDIRFILNSDAIPTIFFTAIDNGGYNIRFFTTNTISYNVHTNTIEYVTIQANPSDITSANYFTDNTTEICGSQVVPESILNVRIIGKQENDSRSSFLSGVIYFIRVGRRISDNSIVASAIVTRTKRPPISNTTVNDNFIVSKCSTQYPNINTARILSDNYIGDVLEIRLHPFIFIIYHPDTQNYEIQMQDAGFFIKGNLVDYQNSGTIISVSTENVIPTEICGQVVQSDLKTLEIIITNTTRVLKTGDVYTLQIGRRVSDGQLIASVQIARTRRPGFTN